LIPAAAAAAAAAASACEALACLIWDESSVLLLLLLLLLVGQWLAVVREVKGPYNEPSHPYMYDDEDMWQAPGFVNEFYEVSPDFFR
jgi:hypothetical protein